MLILILVRAFQFLYFKNKPYDSLSNSDKIRLKELYDKYKPPLFIEKLSFDDFKISVAKIGRNYLIFAIIIIVFIAVVTTVCVISFENSY